MADTYKSPGEIVASIPMDYGQNSEPDAWRFGLNQRSLELDPERRLLAAMLAQAVEDLRDAKMPSGSPANRESAKARIHAEVREWIESRDDSSPFTFIGCCEALGLDPGFVRTLIHRGQFRRIYRSGRKKTTMGVAA